MIFAFELVVLKLEMVKRVVCGGGESGREDGSDGGGDCDELVLAGHDR